jgi:hypothetical protein
VFWTVANSRSKPALAQIVGVGLAANASPRLIQLQAKLLFLPLGPIRSVAESLGDERKPHNVAWRRFGRREASNSDTLALSKICRRFVRTA